MYSKKQRVSILNKHSLLSNTALNSSGLKFYIRIADIQREYAVFPHIQICRK